MMTLIIKDNYGDKKGDGSKNIRFTGNDEITEGKVEGSYIVLKTCF